MIDLSKFFILKPLEGLKFAKKIVEIWSSKLKIDFPSYKFIIILSYNDSDSIVRFHRYRDNEKPWADIENLETYQEESVLINIVE
jgi:hypothetical protein